MATNTSGGFDPKAFLASVGAGRSIAKPREGEVIFSQGERADALFYIQKGKVKVTTLSSHGKEAVVAILGAGDFFGEGCLAGQPLRISTVAALADSSIVRLQKAAVIRVLRDEPAFSELFMTYLLARNIRMEADLIDQAFQLEREAARAPVAAPRQFRQGRQASASGGQDQPGDARRDDRHNPVPRQLLHEQVPPIGLHRLQRPSRGAQLLAERRPARRLALRRWSGCEQFRTGRWLSEGRSAHWPGCFHSMSKTEQLPPERCGYLVGCAPPTTNLTVATLAPVITA